jgi:hypothetical protein
VVSGDSVRGVREFEPGRAVAWKAMQMDKPFTLAGSSDTLIVRNSDDAIQMMPSVPSFDELMWPALRALKAMGGSGTNEEFLNKIIELERIPPEIQAVQHTDHRQTKINYNLAWAKTYLKKVGAIDNSSRGRLVNHESGRESHQGGCRAGAIPSSEASLGRPTCKRCRCT